MSKDLEKPDLEDRLIVFAVRIIRIAESLPKKEFDLIFVLSFVASLKLTLWNEFPIRIPRGVSRGMNLQPVFHGAYPVE